MSRKTRRNALKGVGRTAEADRFAPYTKIGLSGLTLGSLTFSGVLLAQQAPAQQGNGASSPDQLQEVVVTGLRASLQKSLDIKKDAIGVVDAISSEDIGNFPESNLGAAAQRIPGVTVDRTGPSVGGQTGGNVANGNSGAAVSIGQATSITVRGFGSDFNDTLIDGRPMASAIGRGFDYSSVGADFVSEIAIHKTPDFTLSAGDIGATINIKLLKPFDHPGLQLRANAAMSDFGNDGQFTPAFG
ncbi:MAG: TonB-dependent receptor plug domain-containing protein, partial [Steroidobacteraceae bacterium]